MNIIIILFVFSSVVFAADTVKGKIDPIIKLILDKIPKHVPMSLNERIRFAKYVYSRIVEEKQKELKKNIGN